MGGEKYPTNADSVGKQGSPPHGRGKVYRLPHSRHAARITPAWAGKRRGWPAAQHGPRDHPRMGGEKSGPCIAPPPCRGSPPHGRGKVQLDDPEEGDLGITPAWAGKSARAAHPAPGRQDHPRMGGEKLWGLWTASLTRGSPPHGRGKGLCVRLAGRPRGITPAWAGKRCKRFFPARPDWDHPRMGGEKLAKTVVDDWRQGSPPHGRGKVSKAEMPSLSIRITPAWAGKSHPSGNSMACW